MLYDSFENDQIYLRISNISLVPHNLWEPILSRLIADSDVNELMDASREFDNFKAAEPFQ